MPDAATNDRWEHWLVHLLWAVSVRTSMLGEGALADTPVSLAGLGLLENVASRPGTTIAEIARRAPQTQQALSQIVARLEKLGLVERRLSPGSRGVGLHLTEAGASARADAHGTVEALEASLAEALGTQRHQRLIKLLEQAEPIVAGMQPRRNPFPEVPADDRPKTKRKP